MTGLFIIVLISYCLGSYVAYTEHIRDRDAYFSAHETNWHDRNIWRIVGVLKIFFLLLVLGGILRLYFTLG